MPVQSVRVVLHTARIRALATSDAMYVHMRTIAEAIRGSAGDGLALKELRASTDRARVIVYTKTKQAREAEASNRTLTRAVAGAKR